MQTTIDSTFKLAWEAFSWMQKQCFAVFCLKHIYINIHILAESNGKEGQAGAA